MDCQPRLPSGGAVGEGLGNYKFGVRPDCPIGRASGDLDLR